MVALLTNVTPAQVTAGGTDAPAPGTVETLTVTTLQPWPTVAGPLAIMDIVDVGLTENYEIMSATAYPSGTGVHWTVTRGAESTFVHTHLANWFAVPVLSFGGLDGRYMVVNTAAGGDIGGTLPSGLTLSGTTNVESIVRANTPTQFAPLTGPITAGGQKCFAGSAVGTANGDPYVFGQSGTVLGQTVFSPTSSYTKSAAGSTTLAVIDSTNLTVSFAAPPSGQVFINCELPQFGIFSVGGAVTFPTGIYLTVVTHGTSTQVGEWVLGYQNPVALPGAGAQVSPVNRSILMTGLTAGTVYQVDLAWAATNTSPLMFLGAQHGTSTTLMTGSIILRAVAV